MQLKKYLKKIAAILPVPVTTNEYYDRLTEKVIKRVCTPTSICIDVGANHGKILGMMTKHCNAAMHYAFEPVPPLYFTLKRKFGSAAHIYNVALSNSNGSSNYNYVTTDPAYSGLIKRPYDKPEKDETIIVKTSRLDDIIPQGATIKLIKLDIEGGEFHALQGAERILQNDHPYLLFEFGKGGAEAYNITPPMMHKLLHTYQYKINTLPNFLKNKPALTEAHFYQCFVSGSDFFFIAY